jgi:hypothetical protein
MFDVVGGTAERMVFPFMRIYTAGFFELKNPIVIS